MTSTGYRWVIFAAMAGVYYAFGMMVASIPPMVTVVREDLGISRTVMGFALGAWALIYIVSAPPAGRIIDRIGLRWSVLLGAASVAASGFARAAAQGPGTLWLAIAIFGVGGPLVSGAAPKLVMTWFADAGERRLAVGVSTAAPALGGVTSLLVTNSVLLPALGDWRAVVVVYSMVAVLAGIVWAVLASLAPDPPGVIAGRATGGAWRPILASPGVQLALVLGVGAFFVNHALAAWMPNVLETDSGLSASAASSWTGLSIVVGIGASLTLPRLATPRRRGRVIAGACLLIGVSLGVMAVASSTVLDVAAAQLVGIRAALAPLVILVLIDADGVTPANAGLANGLWFSAVEVGGTTGPLAVGAISDTRVGFSGALWTLAAVLAALAAVALAGPRRPSSSAQKGAGGAPG